MPQGAEPGPLALAPRLVSTVSRTLSASRIRSTEAGGGQKLQEREEQKKSTVPLDLDKMTTISKRYSEVNFEFVAIISFLYWHEKNRIWQVKKVIGRYR